MSTEPAAARNVTHLPGAFYCVSDESYFLGVVGLVNSLRVVGHTEPIFLLDCGLTEAQRQMLSPHVTLVRDESDAPPWLLKTVAPLAHPAEVMVLIDADMIVTRSFAELIERAAEGRVVAFENNMDRFVPEWGELLGLGPVRRQPYICSAAVVMGREPGEEVLSLMASRQASVEFERTHWRRNESGYPFLYADQDVLNAVLASRVEADRVVALDHRLSPSIPFEGLEVIDDARLRLARTDGPAPYVIHQSLSPKPWQAPVYDGVYTRLLRRLLSGPDVAVRVPRREIPLRLRTGPLAYVERQRVNIREQLRWRLDGFRRAHLGSPDRVNGPG